jgi:hypothetical protein
MLRAKWGVLPRDRDQRDLHDCKRGHPGDMGWQRLVHVSIMANLKTLKRIAHRLREHWLGDEGGQSSVTVERPGPSS